MNSRFRLRVTVDPSLPCLAYSGFAEGNNAEVICGSKIEFTDQFLTDGVWDGEYSRGPTDSSYIFGTAVRIGEQGLTLLSSRTPIDRLFVCGKEKRILFSNSLPLMLSQLEDHLDDELLDYRCFLYGVEAGLSPSKRFLQTLNRHKIRVLYDEIYEFAGSRSGLRRRPRDTSFVDFSDYRARLGSTVSRVLSNASSRERQHSCEPIMSLSAGYDSTAVAAICSRHGVRSALSLLRFDDSEPPVRIDYPDEAERILGLDVIAVPRQSERLTSQVDDELVGAAVASLEDVVMLDYGTVLRGKLLLTGYSGDNVWGLSRNPSVEISGKGLAEHRLAVGYTVFPVPFVGFTARSSILRISLSPEMEPWRLGGSYDRPIPLRLAEESGIMRGTFARKKLAASARVGSTIHRYRGTTREERTWELRESFGPAATESFLDYLERSPFLLGRTLRAKRNVLVQMVSFQLLRLLDGVDIRLGGLLGDSGPKSFVPQRLRTRLVARGRYWPDYSCLLPHWGTEAVMGRYSAGAQRVLDKK